MSDFNPYQAPTASLVVAPPSFDDAGFLAAGRVVAAGNGWLWLTASFRTVLDAYGTWLLITLVMFGIQLVSGIVPLGGLAMVVAGPVLAGGVVQAVQKQSRGGAATVNDLFACFSQKPWPLAQIGLIMLGVWVVVGVVLVVGVGFSIMGAILRHDPSALLANVGVLFVVFSVAMIVAALMYTATWLAPPLVVFHGLTPVEAMKCSFAAVMRNWVPVLVFSLGVLLAGLFVVITLGLGLFLVVPALMTTAYHAYRDIFFEAP